MFPKISRLFHTLRHMKEIQWRYQLYYRIKNLFVSIHWYDKYLNGSFAFFNIEVANILQSTQSEYIGNNCFEFIGLKHTFEGEVDWNYQANGKLWNYNLQYFAYLLNEKIPSGERMRLLKEFSQQLLSGNIKPEPYPVSLRVVNVLLFHSRYPINDKIVKEALHKQIDYLSNNLEYHLLANHLLENAFSLFIAALYLNEKPLFEKAKKRLIIELEEQILGDGGHYEGSPMYQSILLSKLFISVELSRKAILVTDEVITFLEGKAGKMLGWMNAYCFPDGSWALMNDAAEQIAATSKSLNDAAKILKISPVNVNLAASGFRKLSGEDWQLLIKTGPVQPTYQPGHVHADIASYCLWYKGKQIIVDRGVSTYAVSATRNEERATSSHNTIYFNNYNQSDIWGSFRVGKRARIICMEDSVHSIQIAIQPYFDRRCRHKRKFIKIDDHTLVIEDFIQISPRTKVLKGNIQFADQLSINHSQDLLELGCVTIAIQGVENGRLQKGKYAVSFNRLHSGIRYEYHASPFSRFTFTFL